MFAVLVRDMASRCHHLYDYVLYRRFRTTHHSRVHFLWFISLVPTGVEILPNLCEAARGVVLKTKNMISEVASSSRHMGMGSS